MPHIELVPTEALWQEHPSLFDCPRCGRPVRSDYVGAGHPEILCMALQGGSGHRLQWPEPEVAGAPTVTSLVPSTAALGSPSFTLSVMGMGFTADCVILWNGSPEPTVVVSATELTTGVNMATAELAVTLPVAVRSGISEEDYAMSNELAFTFLPAA